MNLDRGGSNLDPPDWIKNRKATINPIIKKGNKCFQYAVTVNLSYEETGKDRQRIINIKSFINKYNWEGINYPSKKEDWKKFEKNNVTVAINVCILKKKMYTLLMFQNIT